MSHRNVKRDLGQSYPQWDKMEPGVYYQLRGWSAIVLNDTLDEGVYIDLYSYDSHILRYNFRTNKLHAWKYENPYDVSSTTTRHISEFMHFLAFAVDHDGNHLDYANTTTDYPTSHNTGNWCFRGWSEDYCDKPFWW